MKKLISRLMALKDTSSFRPDNVITQFTTERFNLIHLTVTSSEQATPLSTYRLHFAL